MTPKFDPILGELREEDEGSGGGSGGGGGNSVVIEYSNSGVPVAGVLKSVRLASEVTISKACVSIGGLPLGGNAELDVKLNGVSILDGRLTVTTTETKTNGYATVVTGDAGKVTIVTTAAAAESELTVELVRGTGNTFLGSDVYIAVIGSIS